MYQLPASIHSYSFLLVAIILGCLCPFSMFFLRVLLWLLIGPFSFALLPSLPWGCFLFLIRRSVHVPQACGLAIRISHLRLHSPGCRASFTHGLGSMIGGDFGPSGEECGVCKSLDRFPPRHYDLRFNLPLRIRGTRIYYT